MEGVAVLALCILNFTIRWRQNGQHHARDNLRGPGTHRYETGGFHRRLRTVVKTQMSVPLKIQSLFLFSQPTAQYINFPTLEIGTYHFWFMLMMLIYWKEAYILQGESHARGPKLLSMYTVEQRGFFVRKYWQTGSFKACQMAFRKEFGERRATSKCCIQKLVKKLETRGSRSNACRLISLGPIEGQSVQKYTPHNRTTQRRYTPNRFKPSTSTLWEKYSRIWRNAFNCAWM